MPGSVRAAGCGVSVFGGQKPGDAYVPAPGELEREKRCAFHDHCACTHTECTEGWLDVEQPEPRRGDPDRTVVARCPNCRDAMLMADELAPKRRR